LKKVLSWRVVAAGAALAIATMVGTPTAGAATTADVSCGKAVGPFTVQGTQVLGQGGRVFVSYGITVSGLQGPYWRDLLGRNLAMIAAAADGWCANTVRLQLSQDNLLGPDGTSFDHAYMTAIESEVSTAEEYHLVVVLNDNTEFAPRMTWPAQHGPTAATETFWKDLASVYGNDPQVIFDLFNEPRTYFPGMSQAEEWRLWRSGGSFEGVSYLGMAQLADYVRNTLGARNLFWVEGPYFSYSLAGMVSNGAVLNVSDVVYAVHHPAGPQTTASWEADFGYLVTTGVAPVVVGEWTNYEPKPTSDRTWPRSSCWPDAPVAVPEFLRYLDTLDIGLTAYQLKPGYLVRSADNLTDPTTINARTWSCRSNAEPQPGQGAGSLLMAWFRQRNG
jgi:endoglucanase